MPLTWFIAAKVVKVDAANDLALLKAEGRFAALPVAASRGVKLRDLLALRKRIGHRLSVEFGELRLVVECLQARRPARHVKEDYPFRTGRMVKRIHHPGSALQR